MQIFDSQLAALQYAMQLTERYEKEPNRNSEFGTGTKRLAWCK